MKKLLKEWKEFVNEVDRERLERLADMGDEEAQTQIEKDDERRNIGELEQKVGLLVRKHLPGFEVRSFRTKEDGEYDLDVTNEKGLLIIVVVGNTMAGINIFFKSKNMKPTRLFIPSSQAIKKTDHFSSSGIHRIVGALEGRPVDIFDNLLSIAAQDLERTLSYPQNIKIMGEEVPT